ncbi:MAG: phage major capsid protein [Sporichthyaceae bacterium]|nr:phage major capsid protein [Sporichthyaceae bacterium]
MRTIDDIVAALQAIIDGAEGRSLTDEEATQYEALEAELAAVRRSGELRARQRAYTTVAPPVIPAAPDAAGTTDLDRAFAHYLRTGLPNADIAGLAVAVTNEQGVGTSAGGGYTVPPGFRQKIVEVMKAYGGLAAEVDSFATETGNPVEYPSLDDTASTGEIAAEGSLADGADLTFGTVTLGAYKYTSAGAGTGLPLRVSVELLQDAAFDIEALVVRALGTRIARKQAAHWCTGTGVGQPKGIVAASLTANETLDVSDTIDYDDLLDTEERLDPAYEQNAQWVMNKATWTAIRGILDTAGRPIIMRNDESGIGTRPQKTLLGYPVIIDQAMPNLTTAAAFFAVLGDLREAYVIRRVSTLAIVVNPWTRASQGQVEYSGFERADGTVQNRSAYVILRNI